VLLTSIRLAVRGLNRNKLRTVLTMLGMIIGVAAVMTMMALGNGAQQSVEQDVRSAGTNLIHVNAGNYTRGGEDSNIPSGLGAATTLVPADADAIGRDVIAAAGLGEHFGHPLGHGVGLEVHEDPRLSAVSSATLEPGMVVTVEPGIYLPGLGGVRIEDLVIVTENGCERLTGYPKELTTLG